MSENTPILAEISGAELDSVAAGAFINFVGVLAAVQTNASAQTSLNFLSAGSGNQLVVQSNNVSLD
jgi:hypothetical protein